jgi:hypothetical protein
LLGRLLLFRKWLSVECLCCVGNHHPRNLPGLRRHSNVSLMSQTLTIYQTVAIIWSSDNVKTALYSTGSIRISNGGGST